MMDKILTPTNIWVGIVVIVMLFAAAVWMLLMLRTKIATYRQARAAVDQAAAIRNIWFDTGMMMFSLGGAFVIAGILSLRAPIMATVLFLIGVLLLAIAGVAYWRFKVAGERADSADFADRVIMWWVHRSN